MKTPTTITVRPTTSQAAEYRRLLSGPWNRAALERATKLARDLVTGAGIDLVFVWEPPRAGRPKRRKSASKPYPVPAHATPSVREFLERMNERLHERLPRLEAERPSDSPPDSLERLAIQTFWFLAAYLDAPFGLEDRSGLLTDVRSLIAMLAVDELLPALDGPVRNDVVHAIAMHARSVRTEDPAQEAFLFASLFEALEQRAESAKWHHRAFELTPPDAHDYLTKAQAYWSALMDLGRLDEAGAFVRRLIREAPRDADAELAELEQLTFARIVAAAPAPKRARG